MRIFTLPLRQVLNFLIVAFLISPPLYSQQIARGLTASNNQYVGFYEFKPANYAQQTSTKYPLIIFLHGIGERGNGTTELDRVLGVGIPHYINWGNTMTFNWNGKVETFLVLSPQLSSNYGSWQNFYVDEMINYAKNNLRIDTNRIFLTGLSLGGGGVWNYASASAANAKKFAAIAPVCGTCALQNACNLANASLPVWAFHALNDQTVGSGCTTGAISSINNCTPAVKPLVTLYNDGGHSIWDRAYDSVYQWQNPSLFEWFLGQDKSLPVNQYPVALAGADQSLPLGSASSLNGTGSYDPDGNLQRYIWRQLSGPATTTIANKLGSSTAVSGLTQMGNYQFELTVVDNRTNWKKDTVQITITAPLPQPPVANAGVDQVVILPNNSATLNGTASNDPDGWIAGTAWSLIDGPSSPAISNANTITASVTSLVQGVYRFRLLITDNSGMTDDDTLAVTVLPVGAINVAPVANAGADVTMHLPSNQVNLSGTGSTDSDGQIVGYSWTKLSGPASFTIASPNTVNTLVTNLTAGTYQFQLTVTDNGGSTGSDIVQIIVNTPVTVNAGADASITLPVNSITLAGTASDPDGAIQQAQWQYVSGPAQYSLSNANILSPVLSNLVQGTYTFRLTAWDNLWVPASDTIRITVNPAAPGPVNQAPIANAGTDITLTLPANSTTLNGSASSDPDGNIATYNWSRVSGGTTYTIANTGAASTALTGLVQGSYVFRLTITDNQGATATDDVTVTVNAAAPPPPPVNQAPVANAGADITLTLPTSSTTLNGAGSSDPDGTLTGYSWTRVSGNTGFTLATASAVSTTLSGLTQGTYVFRLTVTDNLGATATDDVTVTVNPAPNQLPVANAGADINLTLPVNSTTLSGTASSDPDGTIMSYSWTRLSGNTVFTLGTPNAATTTLTGLTQGTYVFRLTVTDNSGATAVDDVTVNVNAQPNQAPIANAGNDISITLPVNSTTLNGSSSSDPDGNIASYSWTRVSGNTIFTLGNAAAASTSLTGLTQGTYVFRLTVTDNVGASSSDDITVTVNAAPNQAPQPNAGPDITLTLPNNSTTLNGSASVDPDGTIVSYSWARVSGNTTFSIANATAVTTALTGLAEGTYVFRLTVTDNGGLTTTDDVTVTVLPAPNQKPVAEAGNNFVVNLPANNIQLNGTASYDPDGSITGYSWVKLLGPGGITLVNSTTATPTVSGWQAGIYTFELTVTDNKGDTAKDVVTVTVNGLANNKPVAMAGKDSSILLPASSAVLNGSASYDAEGPISTYFWRQLSGPSTSVIANAGQSVTTASALQLGLYLFELTVTDGQGATGKDTVSIEVLNTLRYNEQLTVYPNPARDNIRVRCSSDSSGPARITVYNQHGIAIQTFNFFKPQAVYEVNLNIHALKTGVYYAELIIGTRKRMITKFIKQ